LTRWPIASASMVAIDEVAHHRHTVIERDVRDRVGPAARRITLNE
jgi:hypothetical protein